MVVCAINSVQYCNYKFAFYIYERQNKSSSIVLHFLNKRKELSIIYNLHSVQQAHNAPNFLG